jgi:uncharacterized damage-inducible protein DinB
MKKLAQQLLHYDFWSNQEIITHLKTLPHELFIKEMDSVFPTISQTIGHINSVNQVWLTRMQGGSPTSIDVQNISSIDDAEKVLVQMRQSFDLFLRNEKDISRNIFYKNTKGTVFQQTIFEIIQHLVNHGTYHRGNIAAMIRQSGYQGTSTDYITFLRLGDRVSIFENED